MGFIGANLMTMVVLAFAILVSLILTLLAKQGWRLVNDHCSLLAKSLKAKDYPNSDFLQANLGAYPSYT